MRQLARKREPSTEQRQTMQPIPHSAFRSWKRGVEQKGFYRREHGGWAEIYAETEIAREQGLKSE